MGTLERKIPTAEDNAFGEAWLRMYDDLRTAEAELERVRGVVAAAMMMLRVDGVRWTDVLDRLAKAMPEQ